MFSNILQFVNFNFLVINNESDNRDPILKVLSVITIVDLLISVSCYYFGCRLDYSGIALLIMGSFVPPLYYGFYCSRALKIAYMSVICSLGVMCTIVSLWSKFNTPKYRVLRAGRGAFFFSFFFYFLSGSSKMDGGSKIDGG